jgi:hypothetical protein
MEETQENSAATEGDRLQAAIEAMSAPAEETAQEVEASTEEPTNGVPLDDDQPITPGEDNVEAAPEEAPEAESSKLASIARRERRSREQSKEREDKILAREKEFETRLSKASELESRLESLKGDFKYDPVRTLKELGIEEGYADVASALYDEELGEDAPAGNKQSREIRELRDKLQKIEEDRVSTAEKREAEKKTAEAQDFQRRYVGEMQSFMTASKELTYADAFYQNNPEDAVQAMYTMAYDAALEDPSAELPSPQLLAEALNQNLETTLAPVIDAILAARNKTTEVETLGEEEPIAPTETKTLRNAQSRRTQKQAPAKTEEERMRRALQMLNAD